MSGGILVTARLLCNHRRLVGRGVLSALVLCVALPLQAYDGSSDCYPYAKSEKSILISKSIAIVTDRESELSDESSPVFASDQGEVLRPIARTSPNEPDLAEPDLAGPTVASNDSRREGMVSPASPRVAPLSEPDAQVAGFNGVQPGISLRDEVLAKWGEPDEGQLNAPMMQYQFDRLYTVKVYFDGALVRMIRIALDEPREAELLVDRLGLGELRPATLDSDSGLPAAILFPERGIELHLQQPDTIIASDSLDEPPASKVDEIAIRPLGADAFVLRAENQIPVDCLTSIQDLQKALVLDNRSARALCLLSVVRLSMDQADAAELLAARAVELAPNDDRCRLQWAKCLLRQAEYDRAVEQARQVLEGSSATPLVRAEALYQMGLLASLGSNNVAKRAVTLHLKAIDIADRLADDPRARVRQAARRLLVDAHLAIAEDVASGQWQKKKQYVQQWLARASALAELPVLNGQVDLHSRLNVATSALRAVANLEEPIDPKLWIAEAEETAAALRKSTTDKLASEQIQWQLGLAYFQAAQIEHRRAQPQNALRYSELAESKLKPLAASRHELPDTDHLIGRLYFQRGAIYAVHKQDHESACQWYDEAAEQLIKPVPVTDLAKPSQHGDALVSMGVSYWQVGDKQLAIEMTQAGADLVKQAVDGGLLPSKALAVPYGNLAAMHQALGNTEPAERFAQLASTLETGQAETERR